MLLRSIVLILTILLFSSLKAQQKIPYLFSKNDSVYTFHALLDAYNFHFSGIMAIKKIDQEHRIVFTTETGTTLFDFSVKGNKCSVNYVQSDMKNPLMLQLIKKDLCDLVQSYRSKKGFEKNYIESTEHKQIQNNNTSASQNIVQNDIYNVEVVKSTKKVKTLVYTIRSNTITSEMDIRITHHTIPVTIELMGFVATE